MRHGILGPGGVGGLIGAALGQGGEAISLIVRPGTEWSYPPILSLESVFGAVRVPVTAAASAATPLDILWVTVKATQLEAALRGIGKSAEIATVVPLLNGVDHVARLREVFGADRVIPGTITVESERTAPGVIAHRSKFARLTLAARGRERLDATVRILGRFGFECGFVDDEATLLWSKLVFLAPVALATSADRSPIGGVRSDPAKLARLEACVREACAVAAAEGATVDAAAVLARIHSLPEGTRSSMEKDVAAGNPLELDAVSGPILRGAPRHGIAVSATPELVAAVRS
jgi:2-dehydropantoate 2-reductase